MSVKAHYAVESVCISANLLPGNQVASPKLVNNMSSGVPVPILGINVPNLVQVLLRTCYLLIWVMQLDFH